MKLIHKFFIAFFVTSMVLVGLMFVFIFITFSTGFNQFVEKEEQKHLERVKQQLVLFYKSANDWQKMAQDPQLWRSIVDPSNESNEKHIVQDTDKQNEISTLNTPPSAFMWFKLPPDSLQTGKRISLYNPNKEVIVGRERIADNDHIESITLNSDVIGWLGFEPSQLVESSPAKAFLSAQFYNYLMVALGVMGIAFIVSILLSRHLTKPIKEIVLATNALKEGDYQQRISPITKDELGVLSTNFNELAEILALNQQTRTQWVSDTSHELRTPLTVLRSQLLAVQDGVFQPDEKRIAVLIQQTNTLEHIVDDLSQLASADAACLTYSEIPLNIRAVLTGCLDSFSARFRQQKITINRVSVDIDEAITVSGDQDRLQQLFNNLLENTCKYTLPSGEFKIDIKQSAEYVEFVFQDSAPNVSPQDQKNLFERFYRVEKSRHRGLGGSGLGLTLCKQIVIAHRGDISLGDSALGGLAVLVRLPLLR
ncbi:ATP-binding protein [Marinomonas sp.]